jgi:hypothetical protein
MTEKELSSESIMAKDLVCGMQVDKEKATARRLCRYGLTVSTATKTDVSIEVSTV